MSENTKVGENERERSLIEIEEFLINRESTTPGQLMTQSSRRNWWFGSKIDALTVAVSPQLTGKIKFAGGVFQKIKGE